MHSIWRIAYEVSRYTDYTFLYFDHVKNAIWLKDAKRRALMCINSEYAGYEGPEEELAYLLDKKEIFRFQTGFDADFIESYRTTSRKYTEKHRTDGVKVLQRGITDMSAIVNNPFFRMDLKYKNEREDGYYQKRLTSRHPFEKFMIRFTPMTYLLVSINLIVFLFSFIAINLFDSYTLMNILALSHYNVVAGDLYRLLTSSFLHITVEHFLFNIFALFILGKFVESLFGGWRLVIAYVLTGITSSLFSLMFITEGISLGASGAVYGLLAILVVHLLIHGRMGTRLLMQIALVFIAISIMSSLFSNVNHFAHIGGLLFGALLGIFYHPKRFTRKWFYGAAVLFILLTILSYVLMGQRDSSQPFNMMAMEALEEGNYEEALDIANESLRTNNETAKTYHVLGLLAEYDGDFERAEAFHERSFEMDPEDEWVARYRLMELRKERDYEEMGRILEHFDTEDIMDDKLKQIAEAYDDHG